MANLVISGDSSGSITLAAPAVSGTTTLTLPTVSGTLVTTAGAASLTTSGNLTFTGTGNRILGDFSNATHANRVSIQTSTTNGNTTPFIIPNGTATTSGIVVANAADPTNSSYGQLAVVGTSDVRVLSGQLGTGTNLPLTIYTAGSESLRLSATSKAVILAGGSTSATGTGITFPATQSASSDANTLDDYEEGTFAPSLTGSSGSPTVGSNVCSYVKIGRMVSVTMNFSITKNTASGPFSIVGLPFVVESGYYPQGVMLTDFCSSTYDNPIVQFNSASTECIPIIRNGSTINHDQAQWSAWSSSTFTLRISATYRTS